MLALEAVRWLLQVFPWRAPRRAAARRSSAERALSFSVQFFRLPPRSLVRVQGG